MTLDRLDPLDNPVGLALLDHLVIVVDPGLLDSLDPVGQEVFPDHLDLLESKACLDKLDGVERMADLAVLADRVRSVRHSIDNYTRSSVPNVHIESNLTCTVLQEPPVGVDHLDPTDEEVVPEVPGQLAPLEEQDPLVCNYNSFSTTTNPVKQRLKQVLMYVYMLHALNHGFVYLSGGTGVPGPRGPNGLRGESGQPGQSGRTGSSGATGPTGKQACILSSDHASLRAFSPFKQV